MLFYEVRRAHLARLRTKEDPSVRLEDKDVRQLRVLRQNPIELL